MGKSLSVWVIGVAVLLSSCSEPGGPGSGDEFQRGVAAFGHLRFKAKSGGYGEHLRVIPETRDNAYSGNRNSMQIRPSS